MLREVNNYIQRVFSILLWGSICFGLAIYQNANAQTQNLRNSRIRMAQDFERRGQYDAALRTYLSLYNEVNNNQLYYEGVKRNLLRLERYSELTNIIDAQIKRTNDPRYYADLGNVYYKSGKQDKALDTWHELLKKYRDRKSVYPYVANAMISNRLYDEAINVYTSARQNLQSADLFVFELANLYVIRLNYKAATLEYLDYLENHPNQFSYIEGRIASYTKEPESAQTVAELLRATLEKSGQEYWVRKLLADLFLRVEEYGESLQEFKRLEAMKNPLQAKGKATGQEIYFFAEKALSAGEYQFAQEAFDLILAKYDQSPFRLKAFYGLAFSKQKQGLSDDAIQSYESLIAFAPRSPWAQEALFQIGEIYLVDLFVVDKALEAYKSLVEKYPAGGKTVDAYFRIGDCFAAKGALEDAEKWYRKPLTLSQSSWMVKDRALYKTAYIRFMNGQHEAALELLNKVTENMDEKTNAAQNYVNDALELIILIEENLKSSTEALDQYGQAQKYKLQKKYSEAVNKLQEILNNFPNAAIVDESLLDLGALENARGNYVAAIDYFQELLQEQSGSAYGPLALKRIGEVYENGLVDLQKAYEVYEQVLINYPNSLYVEEVRQKLRELRSRQPHN